MQIWRGIARISPPLLARAAVEVITDVHAL